MVQKQDLSWGSGFWPSVLFLHPDLGVAGPERLVLEATLALQACGYSVKIWTAAYDPGHCFAESSELPVRCAGDSLPCSLGWGGHGAAVCA
ncbi:Alpha-1,3/1,6-mannosyltransferase ALG2 [Sciurus carolinensis]|uniref:Alpha-1,3/1,6-mannosyltransferase ALG2 n=1 Tax=Sciurus carolinensis TaxID=30640 RepID=A0AA41MMQ1_SCICA|nr:Alpha-1,3/1,6-mannosyltransferase ALG2 [Sciurus carolinensis]